MMEKRNLLFATNNAHKLREVREIAGRDYQVLSLSDIHLETDIPETQDTIEGNAIQKAHFVYHETGLDCFADDTGLEIDALDGRPGVYSARYAGEGCTFDDNVTKILGELTDVENRKARFRCMVCLILNGKEYLFEGTIPGEIARDRSGSGGFGYDPVFLPDGYRMTFADMPAHLKNGISHRGIAMSKMFRFLKNR